MPRFLLSVHVPAASPSNEPRDPDAMRDHMARIHALEARMRAANALVTSVRLTDASASAVVNASPLDGADPIVTDGPYLEAKELIGGFYVIDAASRRAAIDWAGETSAAIGMPIEVRPFLDHRDEVQREDRVSRAVL